MSRIEPPFGFRWLQPIEEVHDALRKARTPIVDKRTVDDTEVWTVKGLLHANLRCAVLRFKKGQLVEVELQYGETNWPLERYERFIRSVLNQLEARYGPGALVARERGPESDVTQTVVGYSWYQEGDVVLLMFYGAERGEESYRVLSVHYRHG